MAKRTATTPEGTRALPVFELIDLDQHADGKLLRLIAQATKAREAYWFLKKRGHRRGLARADRAEVVEAFAARMRLENAVIALAAKTTFGLTAKALFALEHECAADVHASNLTWGIGGLLYSVVNDGLHLGVAS